MKSQGNGHVLTVAMPVSTVRKMRADAKKMGLTLTAFVRVLLTKEYAK